MDLDMWDFLFSKLGLALVVFVGFFVFSSGFRSLIFGLLLGAMFFGDDDCE